MKLHRLQYIGFVTSLLLSSCVHQDVQQESTLKEKILLYGEQHGVEPILNKEFELWSEFYHKKGYRDLFVELPYSAAELLNIWMKESDDNILEQLYQDWKGSLSHNRATVQLFYQKIKKDCPATVFHGTDVGHQYNTTGVRFLKYLESKGLKDSEAYTRTLENIKQGETYYQNWKRSPQGAEAMREQTMTENFLREVPKLNGAPIMGIYGVDHIKDAKQSGLETMASRLKVQHGLALHTEDLSPYRLMTSPLRVETVTIGGKNYQASYFGQLSLKLRDYAFREFWRLENAYEDVKNLPLTGDVLPNDNYPTVVQKGQVFMIRYTKHDGSTETKTYRSDGRFWQGLSTTEEFCFKNPR